MISGTYLISALLLAVTAILFRHDALSAAGQTALVDWPFSSSPRP